MVQRWEEAEYAAGKRVVPAAASAKAMPMAAPSTNVISLGGIGAQYASAPKPAAALADMSNLTDPEEVRFFFFSRSNRRRTATAM
jgi:hypothetical protein